MKRAFKILALGVAFAASATLAKADSITGNISVTGPSVFYYSAQDVYFPSTNTYQIGGTSGGDFAVFTAPTSTAPGGTVTWDLAGAYVPLGVQSANSSSLVYNTPPTANGTLPIFSVSESGQTASFTLTSEAWYEENATVNGQKYDDLTILGSGFFDLTNFDQTDGSFNFTIQQPVNSAGQPINGMGDTIVANFSGTGTSIPPTSPVPEPSSLALLGTGLLGAAAIARRRFLSRLSA